MKKICFLLAFLSIFLIGESASAAPLKSVVTKKIHKITPTLELNVEYPQIGNKEIDKNIGDYVGQTIKDFGPGEKSEHWTSVLYIRYKISYYKNKTVSIRFYNYQFTGGAHGSEEVNFRTYDLKTGKRLSYNDIFKPDYEYLTALWRNAEPQVLVAYKQRGWASDAYSLEWLREGAGPKTDNYRNFYLADNGLVIYFGQYQVAPYAAGTVEVPIKYEKLSNGFGDYFKSLMK